MFAFVQTLKRNSPPLTIAGSRQGHPLPRHSAWAAARTSALLRTLERATLAILADLERMRAHAAWSALAAGLRQGIDDVRMRPLLRKHSSQQGIRTPGAVRSLIWVSHHQADRSRQQSPRLHRIGQEAVQS
jgi:hypothetical protein